MNASTRFSTFDNGCGFRTEGERNLLGRLGLLTHQIKYPSGAVISITHATTPTEIAVYREVNGETVWLMDSAPLTNASLTHAVLVATAE
jgi:hypothetical protein